MGVWRKSVTIRLDVALFEELAQFAKRERRPQGNLAAVIVEWGFEQLKAAGSTDRLLRHKIPKKSEPERPERKD